jgi:hypothetical protein
MLSLIGQFGNLGGFEKLLNLVKIGAKENFKCPIPIACYAIKTFTNILLIGVKELFYKDIAK